MSLLSPVTLRGDWEGLGVALTLDSTMPSRVPPVPMRPSLPPPPLPPHAQAGSVAATLRALPAGLRPSEVWRLAAFALLRLNPKECEALALVFEDDVTDELRGLVLDLLAGAGTFEAQVVIRRLLALSVARRSNRVFASFVQRLGILEAPDGPTLRFLMSVYAESRGEPHDVRAACAYALGAAAGQALSAGDLEAAVRASDVLRRDLLSAGSIIEKCALLAALGNAGVPTDVMVVTRFTQDGEAPVRAAAALALRKISMPEASAQLVALLSDRELKVSQSALLALGEHRLEDAELEAVADLVLGGRTSAAIDGRVLRLLVAQRPRLARASNRPSSVENALRLLLGRIEAAAIETSGSGERRAALGPPLPQLNASGSVRAMPAATAHASSVPPASMKSTVATTLGTPMQQLMRRQAQLSPINTLCYDESVATVMDKPIGQAGSGSYRIVNPVDSVELVRDRIVQMGLDPNAPTVNIPQPPPRRASGAAPNSPPHTGQVPVRPEARLSPNAIVRGR